MNHFKEIRKRRNIRVEPPSPQTFCQKITGMLISGTEERVKDVLIDLIQSVDKPYESADS